MTATVRQATPGDAALLLRVIDMASDGVVTTLFAQMAPEGMDGAALGEALVGAEEGEFSYRNGVVLEDAGRAVGGMIGYRLPSEPSPAGPEVPPAFVGVKELENLVPDHWCINMVAVDPACRGRGFGAALLAEAEVRARQSGCPGLALVVAATNGRAIRAYERAGYAERARRPFDLTAYGAEPTEALLMVKPLA